MRPSHVTSPRVHPGGAVPASRTVYVAPGTSSPQATVGTAFVAVRPSTVPSGATSSTSTDQSNPGAAPATVLVRDSDAGAATFVKKQTTTPPSGRSIVTPRPSAVGVQKSALQVGGSGASDHPTASAGSVIV